MVCFYLHASYFNITCEGAEIHQEFNLATEEVSFELEFQKEGVFDFKEIIIRILNCELGQDRCGIKRNLGSGRKLGLVSLFSSKEISLDEGKFIIGISFSS